LLLKMLATAWPVRLQRTKQFSVNRLCPDCGKVSERGTWSRCTLAWTI
jgi:hypothetical protein